MKENKKFTDTKLQDLSLFFFFKYVCVYLGV